MSTRITTARETAVDLPGGLQLHLALTVDPDGGPGLLVLDVGNVAPDWRARRLVIPGKALPEIIAGLQALQCASDKPMSREVPNGSFTCINPEGNPGETIGETIGDPQEKPR